MLEPSTHRGSGSRGKGDKLTPIGRWRGLCGLMPAFSTRAMTGIPDLDDEAEGVTTLRGLVFVGR